MDMKRIITFALSLLLSIGLWAGNKRQTVVFDVDIYCQGCITKIEKNIAFERGVKDLVCNLDEKTVTVTYDPQKTDIRRLKEAFTKIDKPAKVHGDTEDTEHPDEREQSESVDAHSGASIQRE